MKKLTVKRVMEEFGPQQTSNILHVMVKKRYKTCLLPELERWSEAISGEFNSESQTVANTLWAFAKMGRKTGERMMGQLERRAKTISRKFS